jgi:ferritin
MDKKLQAAFNDQIKNELYSAYLYLSMAAYAESKNLPGVAHWLKIQAQEEMGHGMKMYGFLIDRSVRVVLREIPQPAADFKSALGLFEETLAHEQKVTSLINSLYETAQKVSDHASSVFLQWFINEQVEEEKNASQIVEMLKVVKAESPALIMLDRQLAKRGS